MPAARATASMPAASFCSRPTQLELERTVASLNRLHSRTCTARWRASAQKTAVPDQRGARGAVGDTAQHRNKPGPVIALQRDQRSEQEAVADEGAGAVDRIEHPAIRTAGALAVFLAAQCMVRISFVDQAPQRELGLAIRLRDRRAI